MDSEVVMLVDEVRVPDCGRYVLAVECTNYGDGVRRAYVSEESVSSTTPAWAMRGILLPSASMTGLGSAEIVVSLFRDAALASDRRLLLERGVPQHSGSFLLEEADRTAVARGPPQRRSLRLRGRPSESGEDPTALADDDAGEVVVSLRAATSPSFSSMQNTANSSGGMSNFSLPSVAGFASLGYEALLPFDQLRVSTSKRGVWRAEDVAERLRIVGKRKQDEVRLLTVRLERFRRTLQALEKEQQRLSEERRKLLDETSKKKKTLKEVREPDLTDLDLELLLVLPTGVQQIQQTFKCCEERWRRSRDTLISKWQEFQQLQPKVKAVEQLEQQLSSMKAVHAEQNHVYAKHRDQYDALEEARTSLKHRDKMIQALESRVEEAAKWRESSLSALESELLLSKEQATRDELHEALKQLELLEQKRQRRQDDIDIKAVELGLPATEVIRERLEAQTNMVLPLLEQLEHLQLQNQDSCLERRIEGELAELRESLQQQCEAAEEATSEFQNAAEEASRRVGALEAQQLAQAKTFGEQVAALKAELYSKTCRAEMLEEELARRSQTSEPAKDAPL